MTTPVSGDGEWVLLAPFYEVGLGQGRCFKVGELQIALFRLRNGQFYAVEATCPHRGGPLAEGLVGGQVVICPLHGYRFSLADGSGIENEFRIRTFPIEVRDGAVFVKVQNSEGLQTPSTASTLFESRSQTR